MEEIKTESAPGWAMFLAQDGDGVWYWHANKPKPNGATVCGEGYWISTGESCIACRGELLGDWRDTLERRPDMYKSEPKIDTSAEHVQKTAESMRDWFERGELPPVGVVCEAYIDYPPQWVEAEIVAHKDGFAIGWCKSVMKGCHGDKAGEFRPIRTERDELVNVFINHYGNPKGAEGYIGIADAILAAGFSLGAK